MSIATSHPEGAPGPATIMVRGEAAVRTEPDEAILWITLSAFDKSPGQALGDVAQRSEALIVLLDELEVIEADRSTAGVSVQEEFNPPDRGGRGLGHRARARVALRLTDPDVIGRAITRASEELQASIEGPHWFVSPANPARFEAAKAAAIDARRKAQAYAAGVDARLGTLIRLVDPDTASRAPGSIRGTVVTGAREMPIEIEEHEVHASIDATFALEAPAPDHRSPQQPRRRYVSLTEAQRRAPFTVLIPSAVPVDWRMEWMYVEPMQRPHTPATVVLEYQSASASQSVDISQSAAGNRGSVFDELTQGPGWEEVIRDGDVIHTARAGHQAQVHLERAGTFVFLMSETLSVEQVTSIAAELVPAPGERER